MDGNRPAAVFASIEQIGIGQVGDLPDASHALLIQEMHAFDQRRTASLRAKRFDPRLTERLANSAARASTPTASTDPTRESRLVADRIEDLGAAGARVTRRRVYET